MLIMSEKNFETALGIEEDGLVIGNTYDKYHSQNFIARAMVNRFEKDLNDLVVFANPKTIHEVGCGEGYWTIKWLEQGYPTSGSDVSTRIIDIAKANAARAGKDPSVFSVMPIEQIAQAKISADLLVCCEVLEHVADPSQALAALRESATNWCLISVPNEPLWRILNVARGKYVKDLGNTPGHINHWSFAQIHSLVSKHFKVVEIRRPLPWSMLLCQK